MANFTEIVSGSGNIIGGMGEVLDYRSPESFVYGRGIKYINPVAPRVNNDNSYSSSSNGTSGVAVYDTTSLIGTRAGINFSDGGNITFAVSDDSVNNRVNVTAVLVSGATPLLGAAANSGYVIYGTDNGAWASGLPSTARLVDTYSAQSVFGVKTFGSQTRNLGTVYIFQEYPSASGLVIRASGTNPTGPLLRIENSSGTRMLQVDPSGNLRAGYYYNTGSREYKIFTECNFGRKIGLAIEAHGNEGCFMADNTMTFYSLNGSMSFFPGPVSTESLVLSRAGTNQVRLMTNTNSDLFLQGVSADVKSESPFYILNKDTGFYPLSSGLLRLQDKNRGYAGLILGQNHPSASGLIIVASGLNSTGPLTVWQDGAGSTINIVASGGFLGLQTNAPHSALTVSGAIGFKVRTVADVDYTVSATDCIIEYSSLSGARKVTLPTTAGIQGRIYVIKDGAGNSNTFNVTVSGQAGQLIDGSNTGTISTAYGSISVYSNGTHWRTW